MSFFIARYNPSASSTTQSGGVMTLGGRNASLFQGDIEFLNTANGTSPTFWMLPLTSVTVQGNGLPMSGLAAFIVGNTLIYGSPANVKAIWAQVPGSYAMNGTNLGSYAFRSFF